MADIIVDGMVRVVFFPSCANIQAPTIAEIAAGTLLHDNLVPTGLEGFEVSTAEVDNTSLASTYDTKLPGRQSQSGTGLVLKKQDGTDTVFILLSVPGTNGFIGIRDDMPAATAFAAGQPIEVHPIRTGVHQRMGRGEANSVARVRIPTPVSRTPALKAVIAA